MRRAMGYASLYKMAIAIQGHVSARWDCQSVTNALTC
jgi:hypothetical protein